MIAYLSNLMIPMVIFGIVILALSTKIDMFAAFTKGAKDGFKVVYEILPTQMCIRDSFHPVWGWELFYFNISRKAAVTVQP